MPKNLSICSARQFLSEVEGIFSLTEARVEGVDLDTSDIEKADIFGQLLLYKFIEYTIHKACFKSPATNLKNNLKLKNMLDMTGFLPFMNEFMNKKNNILKNDIPDDYKLGWKQADKIYIAPIVLTKKEDNLEKDEQIRKKLRAYYNYDHTIVGTILSCITEVGSNFMEHAEESTNSVMVAAGNREYFELACADTGKGVLTSLRKVVSSRMQKHELLRMALNKGVTSKPNSNHVGAGLWLISQYVSFASGEMLLFSEGAMCHQKKNHFKMGQCGYWKGTIIYVRLPLNHKEDIAKGKAELSKQFDEIQLSLV